MSFAATAVGDTVIYRHAVVVHEMLTKRVSALETQLTKAGIP